MREIQYIESSVGTALGLTAYGLIGATLAMGDAINAAARRRAYLQRVDHLTRVAVREHLAAQKQKAAGQVKAADLLRQLAIHRYNATVQAQ